MARVGRRGFLGRMAAVAGVATLAPQVSEAKQPEPTIREVEVSLRTHYGEVVGTIRRDGALVPVPYATVEVLNLGTAAIYAHPTGPTTLRNPFLADANGRFEFWLDRPQAVQVRAVADGLTPTVYSLVPESHTARTISGVASRISNVELNYGTRG